MEKMRITGLGQPFDGEYELTVPTTNDQRLFRKAAGIDPSDMTEILKSGAVESFALVVFSTLRRAGKTTDGITDGVVDLILDLPMDVLMVTASAVEAGDGEPVPPLKSVGEPPKEPAPPV